MKDHICPCVEDHMCPCMEEASASGNWRNLVKIMSPCKLSKVARLPKIIHSFWFRHNISPQRDKEILLIQIYLYFASQIWDLWPWQFRGEAANKRLKDLRKRNTTQTHFIPQSHIPSCDVTATVDRGPSGWVGCRWWVPLMGPWVPQTLLIEGTNSCTSVFNFL